MSAQKTVPIKLLFKSLQENTPSRSDLVKKGEIPSMKKAPSIYFSQPPFTSQIIAVYAPKGGTGKTTVATNLAGLLATGNSEARVVIVDADAEFGDLGASVCDRMEPNIMQLAEEIDLISRLVEEGEKEEAFKALTPFLLQHDQSGAWALLAPSVPEAVRLEGSKWFYRDGQPFSISKIYRQAFDILQELFDVIIVDCGVSMNSQIARQILPVAHQIILVADPIFPTLRMLFLSLNTLNNINVEGNIKLVINKYLPAQKDLKVDRLLRLLSPIPLIVKIPQATQLMRSYTNAKSMVIFSSNSKIRQSFQTLANNIIQDFPLRRGGK